MQGLGLGEEAVAILQSFGLTEQLNDISLPLPTELNTAVQPSGETRLLQRDDHYNHRRCTGHPRQPSTFILEFALAFA